VYHVIKVVHGQIICYIDADLATDMSHLEDLTEAISSEGYDIATGSRLMPESDTDRSAMRSIFSISYNTLVRLALENR
jgi:glycosyltransferase AglD